MAYTAKVLLFIWLMGLFVGAFGPVWILGLNEIRFLGVRKRWVEVFSGVVAIAISLGSVVPVTIDYVENSPKELIVYVQGSRHKFPSSVFTSSIVTKEHGTFVNMFYQFDVKQKGYYKINYFPRSTLLTCVQKVDF